MKKSIIAVSAICTALLTSCFGAGMGTGTGTGTTVARPSAATNSPAATTTTATPAATTATTTPQANTSNASSALGQILGSAGSSNGVGGLLGSILGTFINTTNANTIVGSWTYKEPTIQFESSNLLAKAGGTAVSQSIVNKITPYYEKLGIKPGVARLVLNNNGTCQIALSNKTISGTYTYDNSNGTITVKGTTGTRLFTAYVSVSLSQLALTLDTTNLLSLLQGVGSSTGSSTLSSISGLASSFNGMKTGFLFVK